MKLITLKPPLKGLRVGVGSEIHDLETPSCKNIFLTEDLCIEKTPGFKKFSTNLPLDSTIMLIDQFYKRDGTEKLICCTQDFLYYYDTSVSEWKRVTDATEDFTGTDDNLFFADNARDSSGNDIFVITNGIDNIKKYDGSTLADLGGSPPKAKFLLNFEDYLMLFFTIEGGNNYPQRVRWSDTGNAEEWSSGNAGWWDLEGEDWISGVGVLGSYVIVFKERSIFAGRKVISSSVFDFDKIVDGVGCIAPKTIVNVEDELYFLGNDNVYAFTGRGLEVIGESIRDKLFSFLNPSLSYLAFAHYIEELSEYRLYFPTTNSSDFCDACFIYNTRLKAWTYNKRTKVFSCGGYYVRQTTATWDTLSGTWDEQTGRWDDRAYLSLSPTNLLGDKNGYTYEIDYTETDEDTEATESYFDTKDIHLDGRKLSFSWLRVWAKGTGLKVYYSTDEGESFSELGTITLSDGDFKPYKLTKRINCETIRFRFENTDAGGRFKIQKIEVAFEDGGRI